MEMKTISRFVGAAAALALLCGVLGHVTQAGEPKTPSSPEAFLKALAEAGLRDWQQEGVKDADPICF